MNNKYDVIIVGGGHAGIEAASATAKNNLKVLLISLSKSKIGLTPCNPSVGGSAKGIVVREVDALGGAMAKISDASCLQIKILNSSKGYAVHSLRSQIDKILYPENSLKYLTNFSNLSILEDAVLKITIKNNKVVGVLCKEKGEIEAKVVIVTTGTYMSSLIYKGDSKTSSGPDKQITIKTITQHLKDDHGFEFIRLKTGTPPRILDTSINYDGLEKVSGSENKKLRFSHWNSTFINEDLNCWLTYTNQKTHKIIEQNFNNSPILFKTNVGSGPRYCPSIEDKIYRFSDKPRHQLFLEPESNLSNSIYVQGLSTSFSEELQLKIIHTIKGLENAKVLKYGYAIEYDALVPTQLKSTLETKKIKNLFFAGQVNGTSGYEEASAQGIMAGINAVAILKNLKPFVLLRNEAYIGVMINDLITKEYCEPYRLLSSLAEYRLLLRSDNALSRLGKYGIYYNLLASDEKKVLLNYLKAKDEIIYFLNHNYINSFSDLKKKFVIEKGLKIEKKISLYEILKFPNVFISDLDILKEFQTIIKENDLQHLKYDLLKEIEIEAKYVGYIKIQNKEISNLNKLYKKQIPHNINYSLINNLSTEAKEKFLKFKPKNLYDANQIQGIKPTDLINLAYYLKSIYGNK